MEDSKNLIKKIHHSEHLKDWKVVLFWIMSFEVIASIIEYYSISDTSKYIHLLPDSIFKEFMISLLIVVFIFSAVYNIIYIKKSTMVFLLVYTLIGIYLLITHDYTFSFLFHNINFFSVVSNSTFFIIVLQVVFKICIIYLLYKLFRLFVQK